MLGVKSPFVLSMTFKISLVSRLQQVSVLDVHAAAGALVLGRRRSAETGGLGRSGLTRLLLHLQLRLHPRQHGTFFEK